MPVAGDTTTAFGRNYIYVIPSGSDGTWVLSSSGSVSAAATGGLIQTLTAASGITEGMVVFIYQSGGNQGEVAPAVNNSTYELAKGIGIATSTVLATESVGVNTDGQVSLADWTAVTGSTDLAPGERYYVDSTSGMLTTTLPTSGYLVKIGRAVDERILDVEYEDPIKL